AATLRRLEPEVPERDFRAAPGEAAHAALALFTEFGSFRLKHRSLRSTPRRGQKGAACSGGKDLALEDPALHADGAGLGHRGDLAVVDVGAEGVKRNATLAVPLGTRDLRATEPATGLHAHALHTELHGRGDGLLHGAPERHTALELGRDVLGDET